MNSSLSSILTAAVTRALWT